MNGPALLTRPGPTPPATDPDLPPAGSLRPAGGRPGTTRARWPEVAVAAAGFAALCVLVLTKATAMLEPDDYAYQASIVALSQGHVLLTTAQYHHLSRLLGDGGTSIPQWVHLPDGRWMSQKNPGYPFLAVFFYVIGALRVSPLFYGALASASLFVGARRWLGPWGGTIAVLLSCTSGAAITFAWRPTMETFTDASLVATGAGLLLWTMLATDAPARRRLVAGLGAFLALEAATCTRYTDVVELAVAVVVVLLFARRCRLGWKTVGIWMGTVAACTAAVLAFDAVVYGAPFTTGYTAGLITFSFGAVGPNLVHMPLKLAEAMPMAIVAAVAAVWVLTRAVAAEVGTSVDRADLSARRRDAAVVLALLAGWVAAWGLYLAYTWTVGQAGADPVHVVRFYLPALGPLALLGAWALVRLPVVAWAAVVLALLGAGVASFHVLSASGAPGGGPLGGFPGPGGGPGGHGGPAGGGTSGVGGTSGGGRPPGLPAGQRSGAPLV